MIQLTQVERDFLMNLVSLSDNSRNVFFGNLVDHLLVNIDVFCDHQNQTAEFRFDRQAFPIDDNLPALVREPIWLFVRFAKLLNYLESENHLFLLQEGEPSPTTRFGQLIRGHQYITKAINDRHAVELLNYVSQRTIVIGESLRNYVKNNFRTEEEIRHRQNYIIAWIAIAVALVLGIAGVVGSYYEVEYAYKGLTQKNVTTIDSVQYEHLSEQLRRLDVMNKKLDTLILNHKKDTINSRIVNFPRKLQGR